MRYVSTRGKAPELSFEEAMLTGLARDGGLYLPADIPTLTADEIRALNGLSYEDATFRIIRPFTGDTFTDADLKDIISRAYEGFGHTSRAPLRELAPNHHLLELFHGPTLAFKDFAMQLIGQMFAHVLARRGERVTIVGATSGDTGSAAIEAFRGLENVDVFIMFPHGGVSEVQRRQMTTPADANIHALAVTGDFDDCQARLKDMFNDHAFRDEVGLAGVNSINWARVMAQIVYYFTSAVSLGAPDREISFTVPTGNFGDILAGYIAREIGLPIKRLVIATNENNILHRTMEEARYVKLGTVMTMSPSMDIEVSSNFERALYYAHGRDTEVVSKLMAELSDAGEFRISENAMGALSDVYGSGMADEVATSAMITSVKSDSATTICPHTAVGVHVAKQHHRRDPATPMITLATAHAAKFPDAVEAATGQRPPLPPRMADLYERSERVTRVENDLDALKGLIRERRGG